MPLGQHRYRLALAAACLFVAACGTEPPPPPASPWAEAPLPEGDTLLEDTTAHRLVTLTGEHSTYDSLHRHAAGMEALGCRTLAFERLDGALQRPEERLLLRCDGIGVVLRIYNFYPKELEYTRASLESFAREPAAAPIDSNQRRWRPQNPDGPRACREASVPATCDEPWALRRYNPDTQRDTDLRLCPDHLILCADGSRYEAPWLMLRGRRSTIDLMARSLANLPTMVVPPTVREVQNYPGDDVVVRYRLNGEYHAATLAGQLERDFGITTSLQLDLQAPAPIVIEAEHDAVLEPLVLRSTRPGFNTRQ